MYCTFKYVNPNFLVLQLLNIISYLGLDLIYIHRNVIRVSANIFRVRVMYVS
jgi:hypothetical protein